MIRSRLTNGMEAIVCPKMGAKVLSVQCVVWAGSLDEDPNERGVAHFLEHMLFKGTTRRSVGQIASLVEGAGGEINAYTTFDKTVFYLTLPSSQAELGFDILADAVFSSSFDPDEFERERQVILEEIRRSQDDPGAQMGRAIFSNFYDGTEAGRPILGSSEDVAHFERATLIHFWKKWYRPKNISLVVVGHVEPKLALMMAEQHFGQHTDQQLDQNSVTKTASSDGSGRHRHLMSAKIAAPKIAIIAGDYEQTRVDIALGAPALDSPDCPLIDIASYILGGSDVSRLPRRIKENEGVANAIGSSAYTPAFGGIFEVSAAIEPENFANYLRSVGRELASLMIHEPPTDGEINRARAASKIGRIHREETVDGVARAVVSGLSTPFKEKFEDIYDHLLVACSTEDVMQAMCRHWRLDEALIIVLCDTSMTPYQDLLLKSFQQGLADAAAAKSQSKGVHQLNRPAISTHHFEITHRLPMIYRQINDSKMFSLVAVTEGGLRAEDLETVGTCHAAATLIGLATTQKNYEIFSGRLEDLGAVINGFSGKDSIGVEMLCTEDQIEEMVGHFAEAMLSPLFPTAQWDSYRRETLETLKQQQDSAAWICMRRLHQKVYGRHSYALPILGYEATIQGFSAPSLQTFYERWRDRGPWIFAASGGVDGDVLRRLMEKHFSYFKPEHAKRRWSDAFQGSFDLLKVPHQTRRKQEQSQIAMGRQGPCWSDSDRPLVDILVNILGGHGGRLFTVLRDQESLAYSVSPLHAQGVTGGLIGAYMATAKEKHEKARQSMIRELSKFCSDGPDRSEVERAKSYIRGSHAISLQRASSQAMTMALMELYGLGWDDFEQYPEKIAAASFEELVTCARRLFDPRDMVEVVVGA